MSTLPPGLVFCAQCGEIRGVAPVGLRSTCLCDGVRCALCGAVDRPAVTDYLDWRDGRWHHVPWFARFGHECPVDEPNIPVATLGMIQ